MKYRGYWLGDLTLSSFSEKAEVIVRAKRTGILPEQIDAMQLLLDMQDQIKQQATDAMFTLHEDIELMYENLQATEDIWKFLKLFQIEITDQHYYGEKDNNIAILLIFQSLWESEFCPAIEIKNGQCVAVLSGT
ncbi:DUF6985 domain-containing protein [Acinetobacter sichuanensis]|uniref:DUF6985 domain-containing protein n=2 Tax=Acinetobacter sichuanensis TaxID=2136183 RepID=A0A371YRD1_9GAMM|nr:hypothetical protein C9E89_008570 [Acinetobacter sichuanensis]